MFSPVLTSMQNPKIKLAVSLMKKRERDRSGLFLIEGFRELSRACQSGVVIDRLFFCEELFLGSNEQALLQQLHLLGVPLQPCIKEVFCKVSYRDRPDGLLAIAKQMDTSFQTFSSQFLSKPPSFLLVAEAIEKPGNLGTILRSCDAVGVDGVIICDQCTDLFNPNVVRASVGTLFTQSVAEARGEELLVWLQKNGVEILAATPHAQKEFTQVDLTGPVAIVVGTEQLGLSPRWMQAANKQVSIPMCGVADSLNVATATTLLLYEVLRQRRGE